MNKEAQNSSPGSEISLLKMFGEGPLEALPAAKLLAVEAELEKGLSAIRRAMQNQQQRQKQIAEADRAFNTPQTEQPNNPAMRAFK